MIVPSPGRVVLYHFVRSINQAPPEIISRPAMVTSVCVDGSVNLHVFFEPSEREDGVFRANVSERSYENRHAGTWSWPPRA